MFQSVKCNAAALPASRYGDVRILKFSHVHPALLERFGCPKIWKDQETLQRSHSSVGKKTLVVTGCASFRRSADASCCLLTVTELPQG